MKRIKRLTKRERKAAQAQGAGHSAHIHCIACGRHIEPSEFSRTPITANYLRCQHGTSYASCKGCLERSMELIATHDSTGHDVQVAAAWH